MKIKRIEHDFGDVLPLLIDSDHMPIPLPNEFIISRRSLSTNTLVRNLRELSILYLWLEKEVINLQNKVTSNRSFSEAEIKGGLVEFLKLNHGKKNKNTKITVSAITFNQRLMTVRQFIAWLFDITLSSMPSSIKKYEAVLENKNRTLYFLDSSFVNAPPTNKYQQKGLNSNEVESLLSVLDPTCSTSYGKCPAVRYRNYIATITMLYYGLRPGELLSLKVEDIQIGAISSIRIVRRAPDIFDLRKPRPEIKRNGRVLWIDDSLFAKNIDEYITKWRDSLSYKSKRDSDYLILSDEGNPLSYSALSRFYQLLRRKYADILPSHLTAKCLRHTFSSNMEKNLRSAGVDEDKRRQALAYLRGDSSLSSQDIYLMGEVQEQAQKALRTMQKNLISSK